MMGEPEGLASFLLNDLSTQWRNAIIDRLMSLEEACIQLPNPELI